MSRRRRDDPAWNALLGRAVEIERRLGELRRQGRPPATLWTRMTDLVGGSAPTLRRRPVLAQLSRGLSRLGVHSLADAQLLRRALEDARAEALALRLAARCEQAVKEADGALRQLQRAIRQGQPVLDRARFEAEVASLVRLVRMVQILREPPTPLATDELEWEDPLGGRGPPAVEPFTTPRLAIAAAFEARARTGEPAPAPQRRDLEVAHALLLDVEAGEQERKAALQLRWRVVQAREALARQGDAADVSGLLREVRRLAHRDPGAAYRRLWGLQRKARLDGRGALADAAGRALEAVAGSPRSWGQDVFPVEQVFGMEAQAKEPGQSTASEGVDALSVALFGQSFERDPERVRLLELARGSARFVAVEPDGAEAGEEVTDDAPLSPIRTAWPSARLEIERTGAPSRARDFVIEDPRRILVDLAAGRQAVRAFVDAEPGPAPARRSSVRIYVCDASASMQGARARFRDALLLAEFESILLRAHRGLPIDPLYYCYFNDRPGPLRRVDDGSTALRHVDRLLATTPASGRTDITLALIAAFDEISRARGRDPALSRASVVLITDGEDALDPDLILRAREPLGSLPISLSFVSLGQENPTLRRLAQGQRARKQRAFYVHLSDSDLRWAGDAFSAPVRSLAPEHWTPGAVDLDALEPYLVALEQVATGHAVAHPPAGDAAFEARFPPVSPPARADREPMASARVMGILEALEATVALLPLDRRGAECVWLLDHLLALHGQTLAEWQAGLSGAGADGSAALSRLRLLARRPGGGRHASAAMRPLAEGRVNGGVSA